MREIVIATRNKKKFKEIKRLFKDSKIKVLSLNKFSNTPDIVEDGKTFKKNAIKKALVISKLTQGLVLADDSGLQVDSLRRRPGVYSSRYAGPKKSDRQNNIKLLRVLKNKPLNKRSAQFRCIVAVADKGELLKVIEGTCRGKIGFKIEGRSGFGYDSVFIPERYNKTFAQLGPKIKDRLSHRSKAIKKARSFIEACLLKAPLSLS